MIYLALIACAWLAVGVVLFLSMVIRERPTLDDARLWAWFCMAWPLVLMVPRRWL
jgi:hypothetical protein